MLKKITHVTLYTNDQEATRKFYVDVLGLKVHTDADYDGVRWLTLCSEEDPDFELIIMKAENPEMQSLVGKQTPGSPFLVFSTDDCEKETERLKAAGVSFTQEPTKEFWGTMAIFTDPDGNLLSIVAQ